MSFEPHVNQEPSRLQMVERTLLALLALNVVEETTAPGVAIKSFEGPNDGPAPLGRCPLCLEFVEDGEQYYVLIDMNDVEHPFHRSCLEWYMETQVQSHGRGESYNSKHQRPWSK